MHGQQWGRARKGVRLQSRAMVFPFSFAFAASMLLGMHGVDRCGTCSSGKGSYPVHAKQVKQSADLFLPVLSVNGQGGKVQVSTLLPLLSSAKTYQGLMLP